MRIYNCMMTEPVQILVEQIDGMFSPKHFYEPSTVQHGSHIYYFKRIHKLQRAEKPEGLEALKEVAVEETDRQQDNQNEGFDGSSALS